MNASIDERTAWNLVRAAPRGRPGRHALPRVAHDPKPDVWLQIQPSGQWETSLPVSDAACDLLDLYAPLQLRSELVIAQVGQSLDGRIATEDGRSHHITGPADITHLHRLRALVDAVIVGASTVAADDPRLTVREVEGDDPVRVILDPYDRLDKTKRVFSDGAARTLHVRRSHDQEAVQAATDGHYEILTLSVDEDGRFDPGAVLRALRNEGMTRALVEGGGITISGFLQAGVLDRLHVTVAPLVIGSGRPAFTLDPVGSLNEALRPPCRSFQLGNDVLFDFDLRPRVRSG